jgi:hypothetical protein
MGLSPAVTLFDCAVWPWRHVPLFVTCLGCPPSLLAQGGSNKIVTPCWRFRKGKESCDSKRRLSRTHVLMKFLNCFGMFNSLWHTFKLYLVSFQSERASHIDWEISVTKGETVVRFVAETGTFLFVATSSPALGSTQPTSLVTGAFSSFDKVTGAWNWPLTLPLQTDWIVEVYIMSRYQKDGQNM